MAGLGRASEGLAEPERCSWEDEEADVGLCLWMQDNMERTFVLVRKNMR